MTYAEIYTKWLDDSGCPPVGPEKIAWESLEMLRDRKGFEHWWHEMPDECKEEIFADLVRIAS